MVVDCADLFCEGCVGGIATGITFAFTGFIFAGFIFTGFIFAGFIFPGFIFAGFIFTVFRLADFVVVVVEFNLGVL